MTDGLYLPARHAAATCYVDKATVSRWAARGLVRSARPHQRRLYVHQADVARVAALGIGAAFAWQLPLF